jgi:hypothetical protein
MTKQTYNNIADLHVKETDLCDKQSIWKACWPADVICEGSDVVAFVPFQKQCSGSNHTPDMLVPRKYYRLRLRAYGEKALQISVEFNDEPAVHPSLRYIQNKAQIIPLSFNMTTNKWIIKDALGTTRAVFRFQNPDILSYNKLLTPPYDSIEITFYPDGVNKIILGTPDTTFSLQQKKNELSFTEVNGAINRPSISFSLPQKNWSRNDTNHFIENIEHHKNWCVTDQNLGLFCFTKAGDSNFFKKTPDSVKFSSSKKILDLFLVGGNSQHDIIEEIECFTGITHLNQDAFQQKPHKAK